MPFKGILGGLVDSVAGANGALLADWEGEAVDQATSLDVYRLQVIGAHTGVILTHVREVLRRLAGGEPKEFVIAAKRMRIVILPVTQEYFLVLTLDRDAALGRALFEARRCARRLRDEIN